MILLMTTDVIVIFQQDLASAFLQGMRGSSSTGGNGFSHPLAIEMP